MNKYDRVIKTLKGERVDYIPSGFWLHFKKENIETIDNNINEHLRFFKETDIDLFKVMNENEFRRTEKIIAPESWNDIQVYSKDNILLKNQYELLNRLVELNRGENVILGTVHGIVASLSHSSGYSYNNSYKIMKEHFKNNPNEIMDAFKRITESTLNVAKITKESGISGIYYAALGGEENKFTDAEFYKYIYPLEIELMKEIKKMTNITVLHICKDNLNLERYKDYPMDIINWSVSDSKYSIEDGSKIFKGKTILGGFDDRSGVLVEGELKDIKFETEKLLNRMKDYKFILGADCTLPTEIEYSRIRAVIDASKGNKK